MPCGTWNVTKAASGRQGDIRAVGGSSPNRIPSNVSPNISEGYSRGTGKDRARFYEHALGSLRECRDWYYKAPHVLDEAVVHHRLDLCTQLTRLMLKTIPRERAANQRPRPID
jgi:hypothetical protein